jgi:hypothetical protein
LLIFKEKQKTKNFWLTCVFLFYSIIISNNIRGVKATQQAPYTIDRVLIKTIKIGKKKKMGSNSSYAHQLRGLLKKQSLRRQQEVLFVTYGSLVFAVCITQ